jgi:hypothetical protein
LLLRTPVVLLFGYSINLSHILEVSIAARRDRLGITDLNTRHFIEIRTEYVTQNVKKNLDTQRKERS